MLTDFVRFGVISSHRVRFFESFSFGERAMSGNV